MSVKVMFAAIDAKDCIAGYDTVGFIDEEKWLLVPYGLNNHRLSLIMQREYLTRLHKLQEEIAQKYEAQFDKEEAPCNLTEADYKRFEEEASQLFPGEEAEYYT